MQWQVAIEPETFPSFLAGSFRSKMLFQIRFQKIVEAMDAFAAAEAVVGNSAPDCPSSRAIRASQQECAKRGRTGRGKRVPQRWGSNSDPSVNLAGPRCGGWRDLVYYFEIRVGLEMVRGNSYLLFLKQFAYDVMGNYGQIVV